ncbi:MAG: energy transducer TonB [Taibaiella sp.]|nr:energy transducer TonB [Taibaiella sp.]
MDIKALMHADYLDIIFDQRNKNYGGYQLRKYYGNRMGRAVAILYATLALLVLFAVWYKPAVAIDRLVSRTVIEVADIRPPVIAPPKVVQPPAQQQPKPSPNVAFKPILTNDPIPEDKIVSNIKEYRSTNAGAGEGLDSADIGISDGNVGKGKVIPIVTKPLEPRRIVEQMPVFSGNLDDYLSTHVRYPEVARQNVIEGKVVIEFVVNEDGAVANARVVRSIGGGCDEEALRVIAGMPAWKPGKQNGIPVKVYFNVAVRFMLQ